MAAVKNHIKRTEIYENDRTNQRPYGGKSVVTDLADLLRTNDADFAESEKKYLAAVERLRSELPGDFSPSLDEYLTACETDVISVVAYAGYLGFRVNLENFHHPIGIDFVRLDTIVSIKIASEDHKRMYKFVKKDGVWVIDDYFTV